MIGDMCLEVTGIYAGARFYKWGKGIWSHFFKGASGKADDAIEASARQVDELVEFGRVMDVDPQLDANILIALSKPNHPMHEFAKKYAADNMHLGLSVNRSAYKSL